MSTALTLSLANMEAKFAREALLDLSADAPAEVREAAVRRHREATTAHAVAVRRSQLAAALRDQDALRPAA